MTPPYTPYEMQARAEIDAWRDAKDGALMKALRTVAEPIGKVAGKAADAVVPDAVKETLQRAVLGGLEGLADAARWSYSEEHLLEKAHELGLNAETIGDLASQDLEGLDQLARGQFTKNKVGAALAGAGLGFGGVLAVPADMAALFGASLRVVQQIGASYGFDMRDPELRPVVYSVFSAGANASTAAKSAALADMAIASKAYAANWTYAKVAEKTQTGVLIQALKERTKGLPREISKHVVKRKLPGQISYVLAPAMGAGFNYWFLTNTCRAGYMLFRELYLQRKYGDGGSVVVPSSSPPPDVQDVDFVDLPPTD